MNLSEIRKTLITTLGLIVTVGAPILHDATGFLPAKWVAVISAVVGAATVALNYLVPNETASPARAFGRSVRVKGQKPAKAVTVG